MTRPVGLALGLAVVIATSCSRADRSERSSADGVAYERRKANSAALPSSHAALDAAGPAFAFRAQDLPFTYDRGDTGAKWPVETVGGGVALLDFDGDGDLDLFLAQGGPLPPRPAETAGLATDVLLRNDGGGRFVDVSKAAGLTYKGYGLGAFAVDFDGDGDTDVFVARYGRNTLYRNDGDRFVDVTERAGVGCGRWTLGAAFADYDQDGDLDLFLANYIEFDPKKAPYGRDPRTGKADYGMPADFFGQPDVLYRNEGNGRFVDVAKASKIKDVDGRGMSVLACDLDLDGRIDFFVTNDQQPNLLWRNKGDGTFEDVGETIGVALNAQGQTEANMGVAQGDTDGDGLPELLVTHFYDQHDTLWRALRLESGEVAFQDQTDDAGLRAATLPLTGWGVAIADLDNDGALDIIATYGHIKHERTQRYDYENPPVLFRNLGTGRFVETTRRGGDYFKARHNGRGLAVGDLDNDGDLDVVIVHHHAPAVVLWNETPRAGHWLAVRLRGAGRNRDAVGARLVAHVGRVKLTRTIDGGGGYLSSNDSRVRFGLGAAAQVDRLEIRWPSGRLETRLNLPADSEITISEEPRRP